MDDYSILENSRNGTREEFNFIMSSGRPIMAFFTDLVFRNLHFISAISYLKIVGYFAIICSYFMLSKRWNKSKNYDVLIIFVAFSFCLPSFHSYVLFSGWFVNDLALPFSILSLNLWTTNRLNQQFYGLIISVFSFLIYPPAALFMFGILFVEYALELFPRGRTIRTLKKAVGFTVISNLICITTISFLLRTAHINVNPRSSFITPSEVIGKLNWIITRPFGAAFRPFFINHPSKLDFILTYLIALILIFFIFHKKKGGF